MKHNKPAMFMGYEAILASADGFHDIARSLVDSIGRDLPEGMSFERPPGYSNLVCCATNMGFALELYIKSLHFQVDETRKTGHDLSQLFGDLPEVIRFEIELAYYELLKTLPKGSRWSVSLAKGPAVTPEWMGEEGEQLLLESLLDRSKDLFQTWRYVYEFSRDGGSEYQTHRFDYSPLLCACQAMRACIMNHMRGL